VNEYEYDTTPTVVINDAIALDQDKSIEANSDSCSFRLKNVKDSDGNYTYRDNIKVDDRLIIYITSKEDITSANKDNYVRFNGVVTEVEYEVAIDGKTLNIKGESRLRTLLNFSFPAVFEPQDDYDAYASTVIQSLIDAVNDDNLNYKITWDPTNDTTSTPIQYSSNYRPVLEIIQELSKQSVNGEFNAIFYLTTDNRFVWKQKSTNTDSISLIEGYDFNKASIKEKVWEVVNAVIVDCGKDPANQNIHAMYFDEESAAEYGLKWAGTIEPKTELADGIISAQKGSGTWVKSTDENKQQFPDSSAYPMLLYFKDRDNSTGVVLETTPITVTNDAEWVAAVRKEAKWLGIAWLKRVLSLTGHVKPKVELSMVGANWETGFGRTDTSAENCLDDDGDPIAQGDQVLVVVPSRGGDFVSGVKLRVKQLSHRITSKGWDVDLKLEIDEEDAINYKASTH
jgi:hypothetical protein